MDEVFRFIVDNKHWIFEGIGVVLLGALAALLRFVWRTISRETLPFEAVLDSLKDARTTSDRYVRSDFLELVDVKRILETHYPGYSDFIVIQYGSSVMNEIPQPNDYDFIVLLLGHSTSQLHTIEVGTKPEKFIPNLEQVDIVFRDYLSFLFALVSGMPYENSVILNGQIVYGHKGYSLWLRRIARNILIDRDFLLRRFENEKIPTEKRVWNRMKQTAETYEMVRAAYYYVCSLLQKKRIERMNQVVFHEDVANLAFADNLKQDIPGDDNKQTFDFITQSLKRRFIPVSDRRFINRIEQLIAALV
jgi:hypothetical protein